MPTADSAASRPLLGSWHLTTDRPDSWAALIRACRGGFFHAPPGLRAGAPSGQPLYARYIRDGRTVGAALGVRITCRLSPFARHAYFPTLPAFADQEVRDAAMRALRVTLREAGAAEVLWDTFDAAGSADPVARVSRVEHLVDLEGGEEEGLARCSVHHRRHIRRGEREGWTLRALQGADAAAALGAVLAPAAERARLRGAHLTGVAPLAAGDAPEPGVPWGATVFAATHEGRLLAAALVGRAHTAAYYVAGGATDAGYGNGASTWLHWRIARALAADGGRRYNLGGVPAAAVQEGDPAHGLHRFKSGFGTRLVHSAIARWRLRPAHLFGHRLTGWAATIIP